MTIVAVGGIVLVVVTLLLLALLDARRKLRLLRRGDELRLTQLGEAERTAREAETHEERVSEQLASERDRGRTLVHDRDQARAWNRELRRQIADARAEAGVLGDLGDPHELVLRIAIQLLGAEKGLLLAHADDDGDGDLDLVASQGFTAAPEHSTIVQRLAQRTLSSDETLREKAPVVGPTEADAEIENLVAIPIYLRDRFHGVIVAMNKPGGFDEYDDDLLLALGVSKRSPLESTSAFGRAIAELELDALLAPREPLLGAGAFSATDSTTLLYSHRELQTSVQTHAAAAALNGRPFTVAVVELVDLQRINDAHGVSAGDGALRDVALACDAIAVLGNGIAARLSGRRLAIVLPGTKEDDAARLLSELDPPHSVRVSYAAWRAGDTGADVIARAKAAGVAGASRA